MASLASCTFGWSNGLIPGRPYTFGTLIDAQALGDLRSLRGRGRRVARVTLEQLMEVG